MKGIITAAIVFAGLQGVTLGFCTTGSCGASGPWSSMAFAGVVAVVATLLMRSR
ncbi:MAG: hypothetical protein RIT81_23595 [Deltaproteobacteria bacterium]